MLLNECSFTRRVFEYIHQSGVLTALFGGYMVGATRNCFHLGAYSVHATQPRTKFSVLFEATSIYVHGELSSCVKVEVAFLGSPSLIVFMVSVDEKHYERKKDANDRAQELCESRGGLPGLRVPNKPDGFCRRKAPLNQSCCLGVASADFVQRRGCVCVCVHCYW